MIQDPKSSHFSVLVVDDSALYRKVLTDVVREIAGAELVGTAANGRLALDRMRQIAPHIVLLDVEMPEMNGLETLAVIRREFPDVGVVMISGVGKRAADITVAALEIGALDFITKPDGDGPDANHKTLVDRLSPILWSFNTKRTLENVRRKHQVLKEGKSDTPPSEEKKPTLPTAVSAFPSAPPSKGIAEPERKNFGASSVIDLVAVGISTGGPNALGVMIPNLPRDLGVPILIVQHMPPVFTASLAKSLEKKAHLPVCEAAEGQVVLSDNVYIAPGGKHMVVRREKDGGRFVVGLNENPQENSCRPSVDVLFRSVAASHGSGVLAVIMTGMGQDGLNGVKALKQRGCYCLTQDEATSTIYGMPMAVFKAGLSDESVALENIASRITSLCKRGKERQ